MVSVMLGDTFPWFFPTLALVLCSWLAIASIEKRRAKSLVGSAVRWTPSVMFGCLLVHRFVSIMQLDATHMEVLQYLPQDASLGERLRVVLTGQAGYEAAALMMVVFAACAHRLPSLQVLGENAANVARHRIMNFTAICLLMTLGLLFPEQAYIATEPLPQQGILQPPSLSGALLPILFALMVMFSSELFAASSTYSINADFSTLARKASMKNGLLLIIALIWISTNPITWTAWLDDPSVGTEAIVLLMAIHAAVSLTLIIRPSRTIESRLLYGERRSFALIAMFVVCAALMLLSACLLLNSTSIFATTTGANLYGFWACAAVLGAMLLSQFMPTLGFDAAPRPEAWWLRNMALFIPMVLMAFSPMTAYILPGVWLALAWTLVLPWIVESDVRTPQMRFVIAPLMVTTVAGLAIPLMAQATLLPALILAIPALLVAFIGMMVHNPTASNLTP